MTAGHFLLGWLLAIAAGSATLAAAVEAGRADSNGSAPFGLGDMRDNFTCVGGCSCHLTDYTRSRYAVLCSGAGIRGIPAFLTEDLHQIESMTLSRTNIAQIDSLRMFSSLTYLNMNHSLVQTLDSRLVTTFPALESLHLASSRLRQLSDFNLIQHLSLREIDFGVNELTGFDGSGSMSLRVLSIRQNQFSSLADLGASFASLRKLDASGNRLTLEGLTGWDPPPALEVLDLSSNQLRGSANASFLRRLPELQQLNLGANQLESLGPVTDWLPPGAKLWKLALAGNPLVCSCALYRDKERLASQGVIISDAPVCRLANGTDCPLTRLGGWACVDVDGGGGGGGGGGTAGPGQASIQLPLLITLVALTAAGLSGLAIGLGVRACSGRHPEDTSPGAQHRQAECPYSNSSVKSTNLTGSLVSVVTNRSGLPYALDTQRSRVFSRKLPAPTDLQQQQQQQQQQHPWQRSQSEQILGGVSRGSAPLPPIPQEPQQRPEDYVDMGGSGSGYQQVPATGAQQQQQQRESQVYQLPAPAVAAQQEGYVDMGGSG